MDVMVPPGHDGWDNASLARPLLENGNPAPSALSKPQQQSVSRRLRQVEGGVAALSVCKRRTNRTVRLQVATDTPLAAGRSIARGASTVGANYSEPITELAVGDAR